jgi:hypothetical protein
MWCLAFLRSTTTLDLPLVYLPCVCRPWYHLLYPAPSQSEMHTLPDNTLIPILWCQSRCLLPSWSLLAPCLDVYAVIGIKKTTTTRKVIQNRKPPGKGKGKAVVTSRFPLINAEGVQGVGLAEQSIERDHIRDQADFSAAL